MTREPERGVDVDADDVYEELHARGWTDGLPVVPPTEDRVEVMLAGTTRHPTDVVGTMPARRRQVTVEQVAVNAVLAGCLPAHLPVVLAGVEAITTPAFNAEAALVSTGGSALCLAVSGPVVPALGLASGPDAMGSGSRASVSIGRALRLVARNAFGSIPPVADRTALGHPGRITFCFGTTAPPPGWHDLRAQFGHSDADSTVTLLAAEGPRQVHSHRSAEPEQILTVVASLMRPVATTVVGRGGEWLVVLGPEHAAAISAAGWDVADMQAFLQEASSRPAEEFERLGVLPAGAVERGDHDLVLDGQGRALSVARPGDVLVCTAGGPGPGWSAVVPAWAPTRASRAVSVPISGEC